jgi:fluoride exporter
MSPNTSSDDDGAVSVPGRSVPVPSRGGPLTLIAVAVGGAVGSAARYGTGELLPRSPDGFPWPTLVVNVVGGCLLGLLVAGAPKTGPAARYRQAFWGVGVLGGFTTFSAVTVEVVDLTSAGRAAAAFGYLSLTVAGGLVAVRLGLVAGRRITGVRP